MDTKRPEGLLDAEELAKHLWDWWVTVMKTDAVKDAQDLPEWDDVPQDMRQAFIEACSNQVCYPLQQYVDAVEFEKGVDEEFARIEKNVPRPTPKMYSGGKSRVITTKCYVCDSAAAEAGELCSSCKRRFGK